MTDFIQTQRLEIKPLSPRDSEALAGMLTNEEIKKTYMVPDFESLDALNNLVRKLLDMSRSEAHFVRGIYLNGKLIGFVNDVEIESGTIELGYTIHPAHWGQGYATEMLEAVIPALLGQCFKTIRTGAFSGNVASIRVMEKCGMERCSGVETIEYRGKNHACVYYEVKADVHDK